MSTHIIDKRGNIIYTAPKMGTSDFSEGLAKVLKDNPSGEGYLFGYIDTTGKMVIPFQFEGADDFKGGVARVKKNGRWGVINRTGKLICPFYSIEDDPEEVPTIHDGIICKWEKGVDDAKLSYVDINGDKVFDTDAFYLLGDFHEGYAVVSDRSYRDALINTKGDIVIPLGKYKIYGGVYCGVLRVSNDKGYGYVNQTGVEVVPPGKYDEILGLPESDNPIKCVVKDGKYGYIDKRTGEELIPCLYDQSMIVDHCRSNQEIHILEMKGTNPQDKTIYIYNTKNFKLYKSSKIEDISKFSEGLCAVKKNGLVGFIDESLKLVIPYKFAYPPKERYLGAVFKEGVCAFMNMMIDKNGNIIKQISNEYNTPRYLFDGTYIMDKKTGDHFALLNLKGDIVYEGYRYGLFPKEFPLAVQDKNLSYNYHEWKFINKDGKQAFPGIFHKAYDFRNGYAAIYESYTANTRNTASNGNTTQRSTTQAKYTTTNKSDSGCYIATAVYGSYDCPEVWTLRRYRDKVLDNSWYGRLFIRTYYAVSPTLVKWFGATEWFRNLFYEPLNKWVAKLNKQGFEATPYKDKY